MIHLKNISLLLLLVLVVHSCKKDNLKNKGDKETIAKNQLVGSWNWTRTYHEYDKCQQQGGFFEIIQANNSEDQYSIEFLEKGKLRKFKNGVLIDESRIVFDNFYLFQGTEDHWVFDIHLNNKEEDVFLGAFYTNMDSIFTWDYPFNTEGYGTCDEYRNDFTKM